jgi:hypothetical protein
MEHTSGGEKLLPRRAVIDADIVPEGFRILNKEVHDENRNESDGKFIPNHFLSFKIPAR